MGNISALIPAERPTPGRQPVCMEQSVIHGCVKAEAMGSPSPWVLRDWECKSWLSVATCSSPMVKIVRKGRSRKGECIVGSCLGEKGSCLEKGAADGLILGLHKVRQPVYPGLPA